MCPHISCGVGDDVIDEQMLEVGYGAVLCGVEEGPEQAIAVRRLDRFGSSVGEVCAGPVA